ncbi:extensin [Cynara cardunculus var. scolymus]|uniref:extensin n=1 Tax=Cynara cardunculus var. scolymus TaxID=59895 RepID=UPI000D62B88A|nr:extensin [Cynara cardunculus var. scolymus]
MAHENMLVHMSQSYIDSKTISDARLPGALTLSSRYHVVNRLADDFPLPPVDPLSPVLPEAYCSYPPGSSPPSTTSLPTPTSPGFSPPSTTSLPPPASPAFSPPTTTSPPVSVSPTIGSYTPSPSPPASSSSSSYPTPPFSYSTPSTPPTTTTPGSPATYQPSPVMSPPYNFEPSPPTFSFPSPTGFIPAPPLFEPPVVYPPPTGPPPAHSEPESALWCVAKPSVPDPIIQEAMNYACGSGADCESLQPNGDCYQPDTLFAHASYAFNSYWQRTKVAGGTCEFGGSAMLVTVDPSYDGCHFIYF